MEFITRHFLPSGSHIVSEASQGRLLMQLVSMTRDGRVLELGTSTGYGTACFLEGAANAGEAMGVSGGNHDCGSFVMTMEWDARAIDVAVAHLKVMCEHIVGEEAAEAACKIRAYGSERESMIVLKCFRAPATSRLLTPLAITIVKDETISMTYKGVAGCEVVRVTDALAGQELKSLWQATCSWRGQLRLVVSRLDLLI
jgi:hypothetical protein